MDYQAKQQANHLNAFLSVTEPQFNEFYDRHRSNSMCSPEVLYNAYKSAEYVITRSIAGDIVELGTWKGGVAAMMAEVLAEHNSDKRLIVYDTFEGHPEPLANEVDVWGNNMLDRYKQEVSVNGTWASVNQELVTNYLEHIYPNAVVHKEKVSGASAFEGISKIAVLRLDMDWYEPTIAALNTLYPLMSSESVLIVDDYGHHSGAREAVDEFFSTHKRPFFANINYSCISATIS